VVKRRTKTRLRRHSSERGATIFVVVLAITLLTGIGLFTVHSSSLLARAAGNQREATQTAYLAELGTLATLSAIGAAPQAYMNFVDRTVVDAKKEDCRSTQGLNATLYGIQRCIELTNGKITPPTGASLWASDSFGPAKDPATGTYALGGAFDSETSDIDDTGERVPGMAATRDGVAGHFGFKQAKITTTASLQPAVAAAACVEQVMQVAGQHQTRAHVRIGPVWVADQ
jgi:hypothetical protein